MPTTQTAPSTSETTVISNDEMLALIAKLQADNARLKAGMTAKNKLGIKVSEKGAVMVLGVRKFPVTFYAEEWARILAIKDQIEAFIVANKSDLSYKADSL